MSTKLSELLSMMEILVVNKQWCEEPVTNYGKWQQKTWLNIEGAKLHIVIGVQGGIVVDTRVFTNETLAAQYEEWLCGKYDLPFEEKAREKYYDENEHENEIYNYEVPINLPLPPPTESPEGAEA